MKLSNTPVYISTSLTDEAEMNLIDSILHVEFFKNLEVQRRLCSYPAAEEKEKNLFILEIYERLWPMKNFQETFKVFLDFESIIETLDKKGHFIHSFEVFLLGSHIVDQIAKRSNGVHCIDFENLMRSWFVTSVVHDFGYPMQLAKKLSEKFHNLFMQLHLDGLATRSQQLREAAELDHQPKLLDVGTHLGTDFNLEEFLLEGIRKAMKISIKGAKELQQVLRKHPSEKDVNHGYVSALILYRKFIEYLLKSRKWQSSFHKKEEEIIKECATAIALHAIPKSHIELTKKIAFNRSPVTYILNLVDNLQEWNRAMRSSSEWPAYYLESFAPDSNKLILKYLLVHEKWTPSMEEGVANSLVEKKQRITFPKKPSPQFGYTIECHFSTNTNIVFEPIVITL